MKFSTPPTKMALNDTLQWNSNKKRNICS